MAEPTPRSVAFSHNAQVALEDATFEEVLSALVMKLQELGVFDEDAAEDARKNYSPLARAFLRSRDQEARDRAWGDISARIFQLGGLLPTENSDGAFLADRTQVKALLDRKADLWAQKVVAEMREKRTSGTSNADERDEDEEGDVAARPSEGNIFEGLGESDAFLRGLYSGGVPPPEQPVSGQIPRGDAPQPDASESSGRPTANAEVDKRAVERQFFKDAALGSPFYGDVKVIDVFNNDVLTKLLWAILENTVNDLLWALTAKLAELGVPAAPTEAETASLIMALTLSYVYVAEHNDTGVRRQAVDTLRLHLLRVVGLMPREVWATEFLDSRAGVLALIGDRVQDNEAADG